jgi:signal transduction histidine kinase
MIRYRDHHSQPPWWPEHEPWPPRHRAGKWRHGRARFIRRVFVLFAVLLLLSAIGAATLITKLLGGYGSGIPASVGPVALLIIAFVVVFFAAAMRRIAFPLGDIVEAANRVAGGDYSARINEHGPPSVRTVGAAFNSMAGRLEAQDRQRRNLMADIAHELRTPLSVIQGRLEGLLDGVYPRDDVTLSAVIEETSLLARLVDDLRTLANAESGMLTLQKEPTDFTVLVLDVVKSFSDEAQQRGVTVKFDVPSDLPLLSIDPVRIREVVVNLLSNALHHTPAGGVVSIAAVAERRPFDGAQGRPELVEGRAPSPERRHVDAVKVTVSDTGPGIAPEDLPKVFDRFYKGRTSKGSGLGLTIARNLVAAHGGDIRAENWQGGGAIITFTLPVG